MRIVICWPDISGYAAACWRALSACEGVELLVVAFSPRPEAHQNFGETVMAGLNYRLLGAAERDDAAAVRAIVAAHRPDAIVVPGWFHEPYRRLAGLAEFAQVKFIMTMDNPWKGTLRQRLARLTVGRYIDRMDAVLVAGERCWQFARHLKVPERKLIRGVYAFDLPSFQGVYEERMARGSWPRRFLFMGRYISVKGLDFLLPAYRQYRTLVSDPWPITFHGQGPLRASIAAEAGADERGFCQPSDQPAVMAEHGVFVLPSTFEPWGVALMEAMGAGLPAICTEAVGAGVELVRSYHNGLCVPACDSGALAVAFKWIHDHHARLPELGRHARQFASAHSAELWAERLLAMTLRWGLQRPGCESGAQLVDGG